MGLVWREQLSVGNDLIDADHKRLISIINQVEESLKERVEAVWRQRSMTLPNIHSSILTGRRKSLSRRSIRRHPT